MENQEATRLYVDCETQDFHGIDAGSLHHTQLQHPLRQRLKLSLWINIVLLAACIGLLVSTAHPSVPVEQTETTDKAYPLAELYSPANDAVEFEYRAGIRNDTRYTGYPGPTWEALMHDLLSGTLIRVSDAELDLLGVDSIPLKDGGYAAGLGVAHNLHCVKKLKQWLYREHFYPTLEFDSSEFHVIRDHADHCLDFVRQSVMCNIDYSLYTLAWDAATNRLLHGRPEKQRCVNWNRLHEWMLSRAASSDMLDKDSV